MPSFPQVYVVRHGETEWSISGKHTGRTDLPLTKRGEERVQESAARLVGDNCVIQPRHLSQIFVSPRQRAVTTLKLLQLPQNIPTQTTDLISEWDYGDYEGVTSKEIKERRPSGTWDLWTEGCPNGDSPKDVEKRVDQLISEIRTIHRDAVEAGTDGDVLIAAHGHSLRAFTARWLQQPIDAGRHYLLQAGGVGVLSYEHNLDEPAVLRWNILSDQLLALSK